jgi:hypothetical protein
MRVRLRKSIIAAVCICLVVVGGIYLLWDRIPAATSMSDVERSQLTAATKVIVEDLANIPAPEIDPLQTPPSASATNSTQPATWTPVLPALDLPLTQQLPALVDEAMRGNPVAACRLALDSAYCSSQQRSLAFSRQMEASLSRRPSGSDDLVIGAIARSEERAANAGGYCEGVDSAMLPDPDAYLAAAANAMTTRQKVLLAMSRQDGTLVRMPRETGSIVSSGRNSEYLVPQFLADNDVAFLQSGMVAADPLALEGMILLHAPSFLPGSLFGLREVLPDPYRFAFHALLMQRLSGDESVGPFVAETLSKTLARMPPDRVATLHAAVETEFRRWQQTSLQKQWPSVGYDSTQRTASLCSE